MNDALLFSFPLESTTIDYTQRTAQSTTETNRSKREVGMHVCPCICLPCVCTYVQYILLLRVEIIFKMGKKDKHKKKGKGAEKTAAKTDKKLSQKEKKKLAAIGEVCYYF